MKQVPIWKALVFLVIVAVAFFFSLLLNINDHILADDIFSVAGLSDSFTFLWHYWWTQKLLTLGKNPVFCDWILPPTGADLTFHTTVILPSLLTSPLALIFGPVVGYNLMVLMLLIAGALACYLVLINVFRAPPIYALVTAAAFGYSPYFVFKAHAHINLIGAVFWVSALGLILAHYLNEKSSLKYSVGFAVFFWASFWSSLLEFLMLILVAGLLVAIFELTAIIQKKSNLKATTLFFAPSLVGCVSLLIFANSTTLGAVQRSVFEGFSAIYLLDFPKLGILPSPIETKSLEYGGDYLGISLLALSSIGLYSMFKTKDHFRWQLAVVLVICLLTIIDPFGVPSSLIRMLPYGTGFRVPSRFLPFLLFFLAIPASYGVSKLLSLKATAIRNIFLALLVVVALVEYYPYDHHPSPVKKFDMPNSVKSTLDRESRVLVIPSNYYLNIHDTYQVAFDQPAVYLSYLAREDSAIQAARRAKFPIVYGESGQFDRLQYQEELREMNVKYVLFEDERNLSVFPARTQLVWRQDGQAFYEVLQD